MITIQYENYQYGKIDNAIATMTSLLNQRKGSPADQKKWSEVVKKLNKTKQTIKNAYAEAPEEFKIAHPDIKELTIRTMQEHGATVFAERNNVASTTLVERLASTPNARTAFTNGLIGFAVADLAVASLTSMIGTKMGVFDLLGKGLVATPGVAGPLVTGLCEVVKFFYGLSPFAVWAGAALLAIKVIPAVKNMFSKYQHARAEREMINEKLAAVSGESNGGMEGSSQYWANGYKEPHVEGAEFDSHATEHASDYVSHEGEQVENTKPLTLEEQRENVKQIAQDLYKTDKDIELINAQLQNKLDLYQKTPSASLMAEISELRSQLDSFKAQQGKLKQSYNQNITTLKHGHPLTEKAIRFLESTKKAAGSKVVDREALRKATLSLNALSYIEAQEIADLCRKAAATTDRATRTKIRDKVAALSATLAKKSGGIAEYITELIEKEVANFKQLPDNGAPAQEQLFDPNDPDAKLLQELLNYSGDNSNDNQLIAELFGYAGAKDQVRTDFEKRKQELLGKGEPQELLGKGEPIVVETPDTDKTPTEKPLTLEAIENSGLTPKQIKVLKDVIVFQQDTRLNSKKRGMVTDWGLRNAYSKLNREGVLYNEPLDEESRQYASYVLKTLLDDREKGLNKKHATSKTRDKLVELGIIDAKTRDEVESLIGKGVNYEKQ